MFYNSHIYVTFMECLVTKYHGFTTFFTLFRMGIFGAAHGWWGQKALPPHPKICRRYPTMMKLGTVIPYLKKIQKIYKSRDTPPEFC